MKMEQAGCSETAYKIQTPGNYPEESIQNPKQVNTEQVKKILCKYGSSWNSNGLMIQNT
jgi:hypothetical protein